MRKLLPLLLVGILLAGCQTADDTLATGSTPTAISGSAASAIAGDITSRLAEQIGPAGSTAIKMDKDTSEFAVALEAALKGWGYTFVTDGKADKGVRFVELSYSIDSVDSQILARLSTPSIALGRASGVDLEQIKAYMLANPDNFYKKTPIDELPGLPLTGISGFYSEWQASGVPINRDQVLLFTGPADDEVLVNCTRVQGLDGTQVEDLTRAEEEGRKQVLLMAEFLKRDVPGFARASVSAVGTQIGIRETRRIVGLYALTKEDVVAGRKFEDAIARSGYPIDIHDPSGKGVTASWIAGDGTYDIPYRCLVSRNASNLLAAGRCISTTHEALATTRLTPSCMATGQAAGTAAALAVLDGVTPAEVNVARLREALIQEKAYL